MSVNANLGIQARGKVPHSTNFYDELCSKETTRCEYLTTIQLAGSKPFIQLEPLFTKSAINLTMVIKTKEKSGVLLYYGQSDHLAVELFHGRVRVRQKKLENFDIMFSV